jgi:hypothetical protein
MTGAPYPNLRVRRPVIAAVNGVRWAPGRHRPRLRCDRGRVGTLRIRAPQVGLRRGHGRGLPLPRVVGSAGPAIPYSGELIGADEAYRIGLPIAWWRTAPRWIRRSNGHISSPRVPPRTPDQADDQDEHTMSPTTPSKPKRSPGHLYDAFDFAGAYQPSRQARRGFWARPRRENGTKETAGEGHALGRSPGARHERSAAERAGLSRLSTDDSAFFRDDLASWRSRSAKSSPA